MIFFQKADYKCADQSAGMCRLVSLLLFVNSEDRFSRDKAHYYYYYYYSYATMVTPVSAQTTTMWTTVTPAIVLQIVLSVSQGMPVVMGNVKYVILESTQMDI